MNFKSFLLLCLIFHSGLGISQSISLPYSPTGQPRMAAEWEPAIGVLIAWPLSIPHQLVVELAKDTKLNILVADRNGRQDAVTWLTKWGIFPDRVHFITAPQGLDVSWTRDWGPHVVFTAEGDMKLADGKYLYSTPVTGLACNDSLEFIYKDGQGNIIQTKIDDEIPEYISMAHDMDMISLPFAFTGGNVISDGQQTAFSTCALMTENNWMGITSETFLRETRSLLGITKYHLISNFEEDGIQHIDCLLKLLDEERILVMQPPVDHPAFARYQKIITDELGKLTNAYGRPYQILRLNTDRYEGDELAAYANSLILNKTIYVPLFEIPQDSIALQQWADAMPGYTVKGFHFLLKKEPALSDLAREHYKDMGWNGGDALHCRTRAVWDPNMIYISVDRLPASLPKAKEYPLKVIIKDYSKGNLVPESLKVMWRMEGKSDWKDVNLTPTGVPDQFVASMPGGTKNVNIQYYISAHSNWGNSETMPRTAPKGWYEFKVE